MPRNTAVRTWARRNRLSASGYLRATIVSTPFESRRSSASVSAFGADLSIKVGVSSRMLYCPRTSPRETGLPLKPMIPFCTNTMDWRKVTCSPGLSAIGTIPRTISNVASLLKLSIHETLSCKIPTSALSITISRCKPSERYSCMSLRWFFRRMKCRVSCTNVLRSIGNWPRKFLRFAKSVMLSSVCLNSAVTGSRADKSETIVATMSAQV
mmetsp:Transcript_46527/g.134023  ORF Transcript_46527/g.134023 Transcript_46527/m.134023 type:complete len:211 (-) Transcript_46527:269-901(-)